MAQAGRAASARMRAMLARHQDPIVAIATAPGRGAVGIVRVSGHGLAPFVQALLGRALRPREAHYLPFPDAQGQPIDRGLALFFPAPHSYTGEDVVEFSCHGGLYLTRRVLRAVLDGGASPAGPGEFTRRAFLNGKMGLTILIKFARIRY